MIVSESVVSAIYVVAALISLSTAVILWRHRDQKAALSLSVAAAGATVWTGGLFASTLPWEAVAVGGIRLMYLGVGPGVAAVFVFALEYTGRERYVTSTALAALAVHPLVLAGLALVNPGDLFFTGLDTAAAIGVDQQWGLAFWLHSTYSYLLVLVTALLVVDLLVRASGALYRGQALLLVVGVFAPLPLNALFLSGLVSFDTTPLGFVVMCTCFAVAITKYRFVDISPIAREKLIDTVRDGMFVVDTDDRIIDTNPAGRRMIGADESVVGDHVDETLTVPEALEVYEQLTAAIEPSERTVSIGERYLTIEATPIFDGRDRHVGWLFLMQDVTEQQRRERQLERQIDNLDQFADLVSHDLRSPINVANGYIAQTKATGDLDYLDRVETATRRMEDIIEDVLTLAREGQDVTEPEPVDVEPIARDAWAHTDTESASLSIEADTTVLADPDRLTRLFENLFRNSVEHGSTSSRPPADGAIDHGTDEIASDPLTISVGADNEGATAATLFVADDGVGIPEAKRDQVLEDGYTTDQNGTGLGLAIVSQIADAHGWDVSVTESETGGARFELTDVSRPI